jgi:PAS domain-containing protein
MGAGMQDKGAVFIFHRSDLALDLCWTVKMKRNSNSGNRNSGTLGHEDLREIQERYSFIVNAYGEMMTLINRSYVYELVNDSWCRTFGKSREDFIGKTVSEIWGDSEDGGSCQFMEMSVSIVNLTSYIDSPVLSIKFIRNQLHCSSARTGSSSIISASNPTGKIC